MTLFSQRITIINMRKARIPSVNDKLQYLGQSLGLFSERDKDKSCYRIFIELVKSAKSNNELTSDQLAAKLHLSRGTVVHHLAKLIESGIVVHQGNTYILRVHSLRQLVEEVRKDLERITDDLKQIADDIDQGLGL